MGHARRAHHRGRDAGPSIMTQTCWDHSPFWGKAVRGPAFALGHVLTLMLATATLARHARAGSAQARERRQVDVRACFVGALNSRASKSYQLLASNSPTSSRTDWCTRGSKLMLHQAAKSLVVLAVAMSLAVVPINDAQARRGRGIAVGIAVGIIALAIIGAEASRHRHKRRHRQIQRPGCRAQAEVPRRQAQEPECEWRGRTCFNNSYGTSVCEGGEYVCRPQ